MYDGNVRIEEELLVQRERLIFVGSPFQALDIDSVVPEKSTYNREVNPWGSSFVEITFLLGLRFL